MKTRFTVEVLALAGLAAGLAVTSGCKTMYSDSGDLSLTPMPSSLSPEPGGNVTYPTPVSEKPQPYYISHPEAVAALDKVPPHAPVAPAASTGYSTYVVKQGDSLSKIAEAHGFRTADVVAVNPGLDPNKIRADQTIVLPGAGGAKPVVNNKKPTPASAAGGTYVVQKGDILGRIAKKFGVKVADLKKANGLTSDKIVVGQKLIIPGAKAKPAPAPDKTPAPAQHKKTPPKQDPGKAPDVKSNPPPEVPTNPVPPSFVDVEPPRPPTPAPAPDPKPAPKGTPHVVQEGQDLFDISVKWGVSANDIKKFNNLSSDVLVPGQTIMIPPPKAE